MLVTPWGFERELRAERTEKVFERLDSYPAELWAQEIGLSQKVFTGGKRKAKCNGGGQLTFSQNQLKIKGGDGGDDQSTPKLSHVRDSKFPCVFWPQIVSTKKRT